MRWQKRMYYVGIDHIKVRFRLNLGSFNQGKGHKFPIEKWLRNNISSKEWGIKKETWFIDRHFEGSELVLYFKHLIFVSFCWTEYKKCVNFWYVQMKMNKDLAEYFTDNLLNFECHSACFFFHLYMYFTRWFISLYLCIHVTSLG